jgi:hypothetical protein
MRPPTRLALFLAMDAKVSANVTRTNENPGHDLLNKREPDACPRLGALHRFDSGFVSPSSTSWRMASAREGKSDL